MLISEFTRQTGLSADTVRFYVRKGLLRPETGTKGGSNPYQIFTQEHVETARLVRLAQSLGFTLKEIAVLNEEYRNNALTPERIARIMRTQLEKLEEKAVQLAAMSAYIRAKIGWIESGHTEPEPRFGTFDHSKEGLRGAPIPSQDAPGIEARMIEACLSRRCLARHDLTER